jgi:hypothetical protein
LELPESFKASAWVIKCETVPFIVEANNLQVKFFSEKQRRVEKRVITGAWPSRGSLAGVGRSSSSDM